MNMTTAQMSTGKSCNEYGEAHNDVYDDSMAELEIAIQAAGGPFEIPDNSIYNIED